MAWQGLPVIRPAGRRPVVPALIAAGSDDLGDVVNLHRARKLRAREKAQATAAENKIRYGRTKAERKGIADERERQRKELDGHSLTERDEK